VRCDYDIIPYVEAGRVPFVGTFEAEQVMLLEFPHGHMPVGGDKLVAWLRARGIRPMIAHPERNKDIMRDLTKLQPYVEAGCLLQLTADAVAGNFGALCQGRALEMLERGWVTVMASDAHDSELRPPRLRPGVARAAQAIGEQAARDLVEATPRRIVEGARGARGA
jgi:protein-tyrosine phosphatase